jgi:hypothetical protein
MGIVCQVHHFDAVNVQAFIADLLFRQDQRLGGII